MIIQVGKDVTVEKDVNKDLETNNVKTTNINILLNRVRLDRKRTFKSPCSSRSYL